MNQVELSAYIEVLIDKHRAIVWHPIAQDIATRVLNELNVQNREISELYSVCNGLSLKWLTILPISDGTATAFTSIQLANQTESSPYLSGSAELLDRFLIFADIGNGACAAIDRIDSSIWYQDGEDFRHAPITILEFLRTCVRDLEAT